VAQLTNPALKGVLDEFRRRLTEQFGQRLVGLTLFGSVFRRRRLAVSLRFWDST
jgi:hypothetical protein